MKNTSLHLNLLRDTERFSSSPVRLRVILPLLAAFAFIGMIVWWGLLAMQLLLVKNEIRSAEADIAAKKSAHNDILTQMGELRSYEAELEQLELYSRGRRTYGRLLAEVAKVIPQRVQLSSLSIPEPLPQVLPPPPKPAPGKKAITLPPQPKEPFEPITLRLKGYALKEMHVVSFMEAMESPEFKDILVIDRDPRSSHPSPRVHAFRLDTDPTRKTSMRMLLFDVEYRLPERRFEKK